MPRKSADARLVSPTALTPARRPPPPERLTAVQAATWNEIVGSMPAHWFTPDMWHVLAMLCVNTDLMNRVSDKLGELEPGTSEFERLTWIHQKYSDLVMNLSSKLRLTPQARHNRNSARAATKEAVALRTHRTPWGDMPKVTANGTEA